MTFKNRLNHGWALSWLAVFATASVAASASPATPAPAKKAQPPAAIAKVFKTNDQWKKILSPEVYYITREAGTEAAFTGSLLNNHQQGVFKCADCGLELFNSNTKFESGTGWPSFYASIPGRVVTRTDTTLGYARTEVRCARCDAHLGHVFTDGPKPTGLRYCMNSGALTFSKRAPATVAAKPR